ncbi:MAG: hypothetical protein M0Z33_09675 [Actinomycetota bacterium]|nr:hypothetical protein [Actinomycetota bacterium]
MVVLLLVVVWLVALVPFALRRFSEWQLTASVTQFQDSAGAMRRARAVAQAPRPRSSEPPDPAMEAARQARERARATELVLRRRRVLTELTATFLGTLVLGAIPGLGILWDLSLVAFLATTGYVALLVRFRREAVARAAATERAEKVVPIHLARRDRPVGPTAPVSLPPARPSFVLVDVRA